MAAARRKPKMTQKKVKAHLVDIHWPVEAVRNPCGEIPLKWNTAVLMEPKQITALSLHGIQFYDHTEERQLEVSLVEQSECYYPWGKIKA
jgi:hypothetical protein